MLPTRVLVVAGALVLALAGCSSAPVESATSAAPVASSPPTAQSSAAPTLHPSGTAAQNRAFFSLVTKRLLASNSKPTGRQFIDNLVAAGFDKANMEVTPDKTAIGLTADAIEFSVKFGDECLVGQKGAEFGFTAIVLPVLATGKCLVGKTRSIDW